MEQPGDVKSSRGLHLRPKLEDKSEEKEKKKEMERIGGDEGEINDDDDYGIDPGMDFEPDIDMMGAAAGGELNQNDQNDKNNQSHREGPEKQAGLEEKKFEKNEHRADPLNAASAKRQVYSEVRGLAGLGGLSAKRNKNKSVIRRGLPKRSVDEIGLSIQDCAQVVTSLEPPQSP